MNRESKSIVCVQSPLQLMNAYLLTKKMNISNCQAYIIDDEKSNRHLQMINLAKKFQMNYKLVSKKQIILRTKNLIKLFFSMLFKSGLYDCVILGDYRNHPLNISLALKVKKMGKYFLLMTVMPQYPFCKAKMFQKWQKPIINSLIFFVW